ncbi:hypothetical protein BD289DRAFT_451630 [Coniella lustricola]|uniref:Uncharacterized protein n=1 Tax=Coniella lustricola TaxID=2025994 RepID=A0A2T3AE62_9PEZI|nr:hypothetical protein BD289DRAFT_451630 [Coniella lustricola]
MVAGSRLGQSNMDLLILVTKRAAALCNRGITGKDLAITVTTSLATYHRGLQQSIMIRTPLTEALVVTRAGGQRVEPQQEPATTRERLSSLQTKSAPSLQTVAAQSPTEDKAKDFREEQNEESFREARKNLIHYSPAPDEQNTKLPHDNSQRTSTSNAHPLQAQATLEAELSSVNAETASPLAGPSSVDKGKAREELRRQSRQSVGQSTNKVPDEHNCGWKQKYDELQRKAGSQNTPDDIGLESLTIVLHMKGRDDLVINTDLRKVT